MPQRLPAEIENAENAKRQLLSVGEYTFIIWAQFYVTQMYPNNGLHLCMTCGLFSTFNIFDLVWFCDSCRKIEVVSAVPSRWRPGRAEEAEATGDDRCRAPAGVKLHVES